MATAPAAPDDRERDLRRMKRLATGLLLLMAVIYAVTLPWRIGRFGLGLVHSFAEAAMVGALADWFAVVALFRHPLGIPFWHTAVLPRNRDRIGRSLAQFLLTHFLTREAVAERLAAIDISARLGEALQSQAPFFAARTVRLLPELSHVVADADVQRLVREHLFDRLQSTPLAPLAGRALGLVFAADRNHAISDAILKVLAGVLEEKPDVHAVRARAELESTDWRFFRWLRGLISHRLAERLRRSLREMIQEARTAPDHRLREAVERRIQQFIADLQTAPEYRAEGEQLKDAVLAHPMVREWADAVWGEVRDWVAADLASPQSKTQAALSALLVTLGRVLTEDEGLRRKVNAWLRRAGAEFLGVHREELAALIERRMQQWEPWQVSAILERAVGRDLQFIRLNGTIIGGLVGVILYLLRLAFER